MTGERAWTALQERLSVCRVCHAKDGETALAEPGAYPLFPKSMPASSDILFIFEAPNRDDTFDPEKGYLTYDTDTDPSGRFFRELFDEELREPIEAVAVTNSVLCLPRRKGVRYPISARMRRACSENLRAQIEVLNPAIVAPMGGQALKATRLIEDHGKQKISNTVAVAIPWFGRLLFPLFHTGMLARNGPSGRKAEEQRGDWRALRTLLEVSRLPAGGGSTGTTE